MKKTKRLIFSLFGVLILVFASYFFGMKANLFNKETVTNSDTIKNQILSVKELTTLKYKYTNVGSFENQAEFYGVKLPFTQKKFVISYDGELNAGIDLENCNVEIDNKEKIVSIGLPKAKILNHFIDENSLTIFDEKNSIFNQLEIKDFSDFRKDEMKKVEEKLLSQGFLDQANQKTRQAISEILKINPFLEDYKIEFK